MVGLRCIWEVNAGIILNEPMPEYHRRFILTSKDTGNEETFITKRDEALAYAQSLMDRSKLNWVNLNWIWI